MISNSILSKFTNVSPLIIGVECIFNLSDKIIYNAIVVKNVSNNIQIIEELYDVKNISNLSKKYGTNTLVSLTISGKSCLIKRIDNIKYKDDEGILSAAFPGINLSEFYHQIHYDTNSIFCAIIQKRIFDNLISKLVIESNRLLPVSLGPFSFCSNLKKFTYSSTNISLSCYDITVNSNHELESIKTNYLDNNPDVHIALASLKFNKYNVIPFSSIFNFLISKSNDLTKINYSTLNYTDYQFRSKLNFTRKILVPSIFFLFLIAIVVHVNFKNKYLQKLNQYEKVTSKQINIDKKISEISRKKDIIINEQFYKQYTVTEIVHILFSYKFSGLTISSFEINPSDVNNYTIDYSSNETIIVIKGHSKDLTSFNNYIEYINNTNNVKEVKLKTYKLIPDNKLATIMIILTV